MLHVRAQCSTVSAVLIAVLLCVFGATGPAVAHSGGDECTALGGSIVAGECRVSGAFFASDTAHGGSFTINETLRITGAGSLTVPVLAGGNALTLNINGNLIMDPPTLSGRGRIVGDVTTATGIGASITVNATGNILMRGSGPTTGARISSNQATGSCANGRGGAIRLSALRDITTELGSTITSTAACPGGEIIIIAGGTTKIAGLVSSEGTTTIGRGGPVTVKSACSLTIGDSGKVTSKGRDPGADLVHLEGGCDVTINGLVASTGPGHQAPTQNRCNSPERPDKPDNAPACVEVWTGGVLTINSILPHNGEISADTAQAGGVLCCAWVDLLAIGDILINGDSAGPFSVHASQSVLTNAFGGLITVKSTQGNVWARGLAIQADAANAGGRGGVVTVEAEGDVTLDESQILAKGDFNASGGLGIGGTVGIQAFNGLLSWKNLVGNVVATGDVRPTGSLVPVDQRGTITLTACAGVNTTGTSFPVNGIETTPAAPVVACGGAPEIPDYVTLPTCSCAVTDPDVAVTKTTNTPVVTAGGTASYNIMVAAHGADPATNVVLTDTLPAGLTWTVGGSDAGACAVASGVLTCSFGTMTPPATKDITLTATTKTASCPSISNTARVSADLDINQSDNTSGPVIITVNCPDIRVAKSTSTPTVTAGDTARYSITVTAAGTGSSDNVTLTDSLPGGAVGLIWAAGGADSASCSIVASLLTCNFGTMPQASTRTVTLTAATTAANCPSLSNTATVSAAVDTNMANNRSAAVSIAVKCPDVRVIKSTSTPTVTAGGTATYSITVTAGGSGGSTNVTLNDTLPGGLNWAVGGPNAALCSIAGNLLTCNFGTMPLGSSRTVTLAATTTAANCPSIANTATVSAATDISGANNSSGPVTIAVSCPDPASIAVTKSPKNATFSIGNPLTFTMVVTSTGAGTAQNVTLSDPLPTAGGLTWGVLSNTVGACSVSAGQVLSCSFGNLAPSASAAVVVQTTNAGGAPAAACTGQTLNNVATASATAVASVQDTGDYTCTPTPTPAITIAKSPKNATFSIGNPLTFTMVVTSTGAGTAQNVTLSDPLPTAGGLTWGVLSNTVGACSVSAGQVLSCSFGNLAPSASAAVVVQTTNAGGAPAAACTGQTLNNVATASATAVASVQDTGDYTCTPTPGPPDVSVTKTTTTPLINAGDTASYVITVSATGSSASTSVVLTDQLPGGALTWIVSGGDSAVCQITSDVSGNKTLTCPFGTMAGGTSKTVTVSAVANDASCPMLSNTSIVSATGDGNLSNNTSGQVDILVICPAICQPAIDSIGSNFNGTAIPSGRYLWFNSHFKVKNLPANPGEPVVITLDSSTVEFTANSTPYTLNIPAAEITFSPTAAVATTTWDASRNMWITIVPTSETGDVFLSGLPYLVPVNFPGGINPVTWSGRFGTNTPGVGVQWQWSAAVYTTFSSNPTALGVQSVDGPPQAGTPNNFTSSVVGGARGGGGSNFTGSNSGTSSCP